MLIPNLNEYSLHNYATDKSFQRGEDYYRSGAVIDICQRGNSLYADVVGNEFEPYHVILQFDDRGVTDTHCNCAYDGGGWCKHLVVVALACIRAPETIDRRPSLNQLLEQLNYVQTQALIQNLVNDEPDLLKKVDRFVHLMTDPVVHQPIETTPIPQRPITIDPQPFRQQTKYMMHNAMQCYEDGWEEDPIEMELPDIIQPVQNLIDRGDGDSAIAALDAITQTIVEYWDDVEEYGANSDIVLQILDPLWAAAVLSTDLSSAEAIDIQINLEHWQDRLHSEFEISAEALRQGWNDPQLVAVLQGHSEDLWEDDRPAYADRLAQIRLQILLLQERYPEYLNLARAEEQIQNAN